MGRPARIMVEIFFVKMTISFCGIEPNGPQVISAFIPVFFFCLISARTMLRKPSPRSLFLAAVAFGA
jgi:uncharacterized paraquat-inducible protein A